MKTGLPNSLIDTSFVLRNRARDDRDVHFQILTNAPERYIVRPAQGILHQNEIFQITITLKPVEVVYFLNIDIYALFFKELLSCCDITFCFFLHSSF